MLRVCFVFLEVAQRFRAVIVSVSTSEKPHAPTFFCFAVNPLHSVKFWSLSSLKRSFLSSFFFLPPSLLLDHGGHRGSQLDRAAPHRSAVGSPEQRVRHLQERHAAYR